MSIDRFPIIRIELEGVRQQVANRLWFVDRSHWKVGEVAGFVVRAPTAERARAIVVEERAYGSEGRDVWLANQVSVRPCTHEGEEGIVTTEIGTTPPCP